MLGTSSNTTTAPADNLFAFFFPLLSFLRLSTRDRGTQGSVLLFRTEDGGVLRHGKESPGR